MGDTILRISYYLIKDDVNYEDLGGDYFDKRKPEALAKNLVRRLEKLGYKVDLRTSKPAA